MSKFKNTEELEKAYKELEREFTKKSQKLAEVEKTNYVTLLHNEMDNLLNDYAKRRISDLEAKLAESEKKNFELVATINLKEHEPAFCTLADRDCEALGQVEELKQQLAEKDQAIDIIEKYILFYVNESGTWKEISPEYTSRGYNITGLTAGRSYTFRGACLADQSDIQQNDALNITTEAMASLPNSDFESWTAWFACWNYRGGKK